VSSQSQDIDADEELFDENVSSSEETSNNHSDLTSEKVYEVLIPNYKDFNWKLPPNFNLGTTKFQNFLGGGGGGMPPDPPRKFSMRNECALQTYLARRHTLKPTSIFSNNACMC